jgi:cardiolipin synthase
MHEFEWLIFSYVVVEVVGFVMAGRAVMTARTSQGAIAWAISLVTFPLFAVPLYLIFGRRRFERNVAARRAVNFALAPVLADLEKRAPTGEEATSHIENARLQALSRLAKFPFVGGNDARLLIDGESTFDALFSEIETASDYILVQYYLIRDDNIGRDLQRRLLAKLAKVSSCCCCTTASAVGDWTNILPNSGAGVPKSPNSVSPAG